MKDESDNVTPELAEIRLKLNLRAAKQLHEDGHDDLAWELLFEWALANAEGLES